MGGGEEGWRVDLEADAEEVEELEAEGVALVSEGVQEGLIGLDCWGQGLLGFGVFEFAKVKGSKSC